MADRALLIEVLRTAKDGNWRWSSDAVGCKGEPKRDLWDLLEEEGTILFEGPFYKLSRFGSRLLLLLEKLE